MSSVSFAELFEKSLQTVQMQIGEIIEGVVVGIDGKFVLVDVGLKSEGPIPIDQFVNSSGELTVELGDTVKVVLESPADIYGETRLSREKAERIAAWAKLVDAHEKGGNVVGLVTGKVKGGFTVSVEGVRAFLPGSLADIRPIVDSSFLEDGEFPFKIIKIDEKRSNIVVSRRAVLEEDDSSGRKKLLETLQEGQVIQGVVKNLTDYGAFIDLGGVDGLLHITDIAWKRVKLPSDVLGIGQNVEVVVLKFDSERGRVSLGMKQLHQDPWVDIKAHYPVGTRLTGCVTNLTDYGCFVEIEDGVEGLVHMSEMDWTNKNIHPSKVVKLNDEVEVVVLEIDGDRRRISLGMKQCGENPWVDFANSHNKGERIVGKIKSITDFGMFVGLDGGIDGLIHLSDISWTEPGEKAIRKYQKGSEIEAVILTIDFERERISLGIKQLEHDVLGGYLEEHPKGSVVKGTVVQVDEKQAILSLAENVEGRIKASEVAIERVSDVRDYLQIGNEVESRIIGINIRDRLLNLSIRARAVDENGKSIAGNSEELENTTLGDLLKQQMDTKSVQDAEEHDVNSDDG